MRKLSFNEKRALAGVATAAAVLCSASYFLHLHVFGAADKSVMIVSFVLLGIDVLYVGPTVEELRDYRAKQRTDSRHR